MDFPPLNFLPTGSGGVPPFGQDFNGIFNQITLWSQWQNAGGLVPYDNTFAGQIGGYPKGALLASATAGKVWLNLADDNTVDPDGAGTNWIALANSINVQSGQYLYAVAGGSANVITATLAPAPSSIAAGLQIRLKISTTNTSSATLNVNGLGAKPIVLLGATALTGGELVAGSIVSFNYDGTSFIAGDGISSGVYVGTQYYQTPVL